MSELDLTAAAEPVAHMLADLLYYDANERDPVWDFSSEERRDEWRSVARIALRTAAPLIEAAVREKVAREIEVERNRVGSAPHRYAQTAMMRAASIARGES